jgi:hypothetical protein
MLTNFNWQSSPDVRETAVQRMRYGSYVVYGEFDKLT